MHAAHDLDANFKLPTPAPTRPKHEGCVPHDGEQCGSFNIICGENECSVIVLTYSILNMSDGFHVTGSS